MLPISLLREIIMEIKIEIIQKVMLSSYPKYVFLNPQFRGRIKDGWGRGGTGVGAIVSTIVPLL